MHAHPRRLFSVNALLCDLEIYRSAIPEQFNSESLITFFIGCYHLIFLKGLIPYYLVLSAQIGDRGFSKRHAKPLKINMAM